MHKVWPPKRPSPQFPQFWLGWNIKPPAWDRSLLTGAPEEARREGILYLGTILCPTTVGQWEVIEPGPGELSPGLPGAEQSGEMHKDEALATSAPEGEPEWTVRRLSKSKQIHLCLAELPPYKLHHLGVETPFPGPQTLSRQDVCSYIVDPRDVSCSKR